MQQEKGKKLTYKERVLIVPTRLISPAHRHFMLDIMGILSHSKKSDKIAYDQVALKIPSLCQEKRCNSFIIFQTVEDQLFLHIGKCPNGPTITFNVMNIHTLQQLQLAGNFSRKGRAILSFDKRFETSIKYKLIKELLVHVFSPEVRFQDTFADRIMSFFTEGEAQNRIWFRSYSVDGLVEIGPRFVLEIVDIKEGCLKGTKLYQGIDVKIEQVQKGKRMKKSERKIQKLLDKLNNSDHEDDNVKEEDGQALESYDED